MKNIFDTPLYPYKRCNDQDNKDSINKYKVVVVGAGPVGLCAAIDLAKQGIQTIVIDENDKVSFGSRAICFAKRPLEIFQRIGCGENIFEKGVIWNKGVTYFKNHRVFDFDLLPEKGHKYPAFINLQQYYLEIFLFEQLMKMKNNGSDVEIRGGGKVVGLQQNEQDVTLAINTIDGEYNIKADWVIACDGANSTIREIMKLEFIGRQFEDNFLIADVKMKADFPSERWFWFDPPFNPGQSALLHKQPDNIWRIDLQLGWDIDKEKEQKKENVIPRLKAMLGDDVQFELEWISIYTFQSRRMKQFRHNKVFFAGDSAHQVSPFGARGANSGIADVDNLIWKLKYVIEGKADEELLDSYDVERIYAADENVLNSSRSTDFITPKSKISRVFRDAVLDLAQKYPFAQPLVNSGRLSVPSVYDESQFFCEDEMIEAPNITRPGAPAVDAPIENEFLLNKLGNKFIVLALGEIKGEIKDEIKNIENPEVKVIMPEINKYIKERYMGKNDKAVYLIRPDQHIVGRWGEVNVEKIDKAMKIALGKK